SGFGLPAYIWKCLATFAGHSSLVTCRCPGPNGLHRERSLLPNAVRHPGHSSGKTLDVIQVTGLAYKIEGAERLPHLFPPWSEGGELLPRFNISSLLDDPSLHAARQWGAHFRHLVVRPLDSGHEAASVNRLLFLQTEVQVA